MGNSITIGGEPDNFALMAGLGGFGRVGYAAWQSMSVGVKYITGTSFAFSQVIAEPDQSLNYVGLGLVSKVKYLSKVDNFAPSAKGVGSSFSGAANKIDDVSVKWPKNRGFVAGEGGRASVLPGQTLDRFGGNHGSFMSPSGTPASARSLTPGTELKPLNSFEVLKPFEVDAGRAAPWFKQPGGGLQFDLGTRTVQDLIDAQILRPLQ